MIETAKFNVITAYSGAEAIATLKRFADVDGIVLDAGIRDMSCSELVQKLKQIKANLPVIVVGRPGQWHWGRRLLSGVVRPEEAAEIYCRSCSLRRRQSSRSGMSRFRTGEGLHLTNINAIWEIAP